MTKIPGITLLIWGTLLFGHWFFPELFKQDAIQFPLALLFSIFLPISFWQVAKSKKRKYLALIFVGIFVVNISFLAVVMRSSLGMQQQVAERIHRGIDQNIAEYLVHGADSNKRRVAARLIYQHYGVALPFKNSSASYSLYVPSQVDKKKFQENFFANNDRIMQQSKFAASFSTALVLLLLHVGLFIALLVFLVLYDEDDKSENEQDVESVQA
ncbi:MAG: hypothetical protein D3912_10340 [Candidatus Electrothrix sp. AX1]|jgi:hypothetical protein|nr:hypothetical protein [Candidatus Electrothrix sp. AX1]